MKTFEKMRFILKFWLLAFVLASEQCADHILGEACVGYCSTINVECIEKCSGNRNCIEFCNSNQAKCINSCPCYGECADGCGDCESSFCQCVDPESNSDFINCERYFTGVYVDCASDCGSDLACNSVCARQFDENMKQCPCQEQCPAGCPCPQYDCSTTTSTASTAQTTAATTELMTTKPTNMVMLFLSTYRERNDCNKLML